MAGTRDPLSDLEQMLSQHRKTALFEPIFASVTKTLDAIDCDHALQVEAGRFALIAVAELTGWTVEQVKADGASSLGTLDCKAVRSAAEHALSSAERCARVSGSLQGNVWILLNSALVARQEALAARSDRDAAYPANISTVILEKLSEYIRIYASSSGSSTGSGAGGSPDRPPISRAKSSATENVQGNGVAGFVIFLTFIGSLSAGFLQLPHWVTWILAVLSGLAMQYYEVGRFHSVLRFVRDFVVLLLTLSLIEWGARMASFYMTGNSAG